MAQLPLNLLEYEEVARARMTATAFGYYVGGSDDEFTLRENRQCFAQWLIRPRMLTGVVQPDLTTTVLGIPLSMPVIVAPTAYHQLAHPEGEIATAKAAAALDTLMCLSTLSTTSLEDTASASSHPKWFQLYVFRDRAITHDLVQRAHASGYQAIVFTVDVPGVSRRERDMRNGFALPEGVAMRSLRAEGLQGLPTDADGSALTAFIAQQFDPSLTWDAVDWLRSLSPLPVIVKGILTAEDARLAAEHGASAVVVSNHGGRQLDSTLTALDALPEIVAAVGNTIEVYMDGGIRRGTDVIKSLALGARAVLLGRPVLWGLAANGAAGAQHVLTLLRDELAGDMRLAGMPDVKTLDQSWLMRNTRV